MKTITPRSVLPVLLPLVSLLWAACATTPKSSAPEPTTATLPAATSPATSTPSNAPPAPPESPASSSAPAPVDLSAVPLDTELPIVADVRHGSLENGLRYFVRRHAHPEQRAEVRLLIDAGSILEDEDQQGLAHFLEHMAFNGTEHFEKNELVSFLESIGMRFGADLNASTNFDETIYQLTVPTDDPELLETALEILEDWAHRMTLDPKEIDKERGVVIEEWRLGRGAGARIRDHQIPVLFRDSRYAERLPIGKVEILESAPREALERYYRDWYRPDLMAVVAVGDFDAERVEAIIRERFGRIPAVENPRPRKVFEVPDHAETLWSLQTDPEVTRTSLSVYYKLPLESEGTYGDYRRSLVEGIYHALLNSRLYEIAQRPEPPFLFGSAGTTSMVRSLGVYLQTAAVRDGEVAQGLDALLTEVERVERHGFLEGELERIKKDILRGYEQTWRERDKAHSAGLAAELGRHFFFGEPVPGIDLELEMVRSFLPTITLEEVNDLAARWITEENRVILISAPEKEGVGLPAQEALLAVYDEVAEREIEPWVDRTLDAPLLAELPTAAAVVEEGGVPEIGVIEWRLANGVRVLLKSTDFRNDQILLTGWSPGGHSLVEDDRFTSASFASTLVGRGGLDRFSQIELDKALAGKVAGVNAYIAELEEGVSGHASPEDLETLFQLLYLTFTAPRLDMDVYQALYGRLEVAVENRLSHPGTVFRDRLNEVMSQGHPRRQPLSEEVLAKLDPQTSLEIYRERFADASDFTFILVGNLDLATLRPLVETYLGGLPTTRREETWRDIGVRPPSEVVEMKVEKGLEPQSQVRLYFTGPAEYSRDEQYLLSSLGQALTIRLREVLREDLGATYGVGVSGSISVRPTEQYNVSVAFGCAPSEVDSLVETVFAEIEAIQRDGISETYVEKVREAQRRKRETDVKENGFWLGVLKTYYSRQLDPRLILDYDALVEGLTAERMQQAARRYIDRDRYVLGVLLPESTEEETALAATETQP